MAEQTPPPSEQPQNPSQKQTDPSAKKSGFNLLGHAKDVLNQTNDALMQSFQGSGGSSNNAAKDNKLPDVASNKTVSPNETGTPQTPAQATAGPEPVTITEGAATEDAASQASHLANHLMASHLAPPTTQPPEQGIPTNPSLPDSQSSGVQPPDAQPPITQPFTGNETAAQSTAQPEAGAPQSVSGQIQNPQTGSNSTYIFVNNPETNTGNPPPATQNQSTFFQSHTTEIKTLPTPQNDNNGVAAWVIIFVFLLLFSVTGLGYVYMNHPEWLGLSPKVTPPAPVATQATPVAPTKPNPTPKTVVVPAPATDLKGIPHEEAIQELISLNLVSLNGNEFQPMAPLTRGEFVTWLVKTWNRTHTENHTLRYIPAEAVLFPDLTSDHPAYVYVQMLARTGYLYGYEDGSFKPNQAITREEMLYMSDVIHKMQRRETAEQDSYLSLLSKTYLDGDKADRRYARSIYENQDRNQYIWGKTELIKPKEQAKRYEAALAVYRLQQICTVSSLAQTVRQLNQSTDRCAHEF